MEIFSFWINLIFCFIMYACVYTRMYICVCCMCGLRSAAIFLATLTFKAEGWWCSSLVVLSMHEALVSIPIQKKRKAVCSIYLCPCRIEVSFSLLSPTLWFLILGTAQAFVHARKMFYIVLHSSWTWQHAQIPIISISLYMFMKLNIVIQCH